MTATALAPHSGGEVHTEAEFGKLVLRHAYTPMEDERPQKWVGGLSVPRHPAADPLYPMVGMGDERRATAARSQKRALGRQPAGPQSTTLQAVQDAIKRPNHEENREIATIVCR